MLLKSLEIKGFKSFADKTILHFDKGITGVIGPNGCGKSNIIDAIRWVIGEQRISTLRSENLDSLVFNGSKTRNASSFAEVSLIFDNTKNLLPTEFNEICITRRFFKNGESEYRLNDVSCRLKDIHNLLLDTGVSNDSYSIIELAMVDDIIRDKENSRRRMLEQAAGITVYKNRKKEATSKLDATELDIARIEDILFEINNQLKILELQAKKAEKYYELKQEYKTVSIELAKSHILGYNDIYKNLSEKQIAESDFKLKIETEIAQEVAKLEQEKNKLIEQENQLHNCQVEFNQLTKQLTEQEHERKIKLQQIVYLNEKTSNLTNFIQKSELQINQLNQNVLETTNALIYEDTQLQNIQIQLNNYKEILASKRQEYDLYRKELDYKRTENQKIQFEKFEIEKKIALIQSNIDSLNKQIQRLEQDKQNNSLQLNDINQQLKVVEENFKKENKEKEQLIVINTKIQKEILENQNKIEELRNSLVAENRILDSKKNEYNLLKNMIESLEGYPDSVKYLYKNKDWDTPAIVVSDILFVNENYRTAIENVLEPYLNYFVVQNYEQAIKALNLLDANKKGKANFFILDNLQNIDVSSKNTPPLNTKPAIDCIEIDTQYLALFKFLLKDVYITEDAVPTNTKTGLIIVEKTGKWVSGKYALSGGSIGVFEGKKIGRKKNLEKLIPFIENQEKLVLKLTENLQKHITILDSLKKEIKDNEIRQKEFSINQITNQINSLKNKIEFIIQSGTQLDKNLTELKERSEKDLNSNNIFNEEYKILLIKYESENKTFIQDEKKYFEVEQSYHQITNQYNDINLSFTKQQSRIHSLKQELNFKDNQIKELTQQVKLSTDEFSAINQDLATTKQLIEAMSKEIENLLKKKEIDEKKLNIIDQEYYNFKNQIKEKEEIIKSKIKIKENNNLVLNEIKDKLNEIKFELAGLKERLHVEFKIELETLFEQAKNTEQSIEELQEISAKIKKRFDNIGEINPTAIEAFQEMKLRYDFIMEQKTDLVDAKQSLLQTIQEVETTANQQFLDTFNQVKINFQKVFKTLFTEEDTADLILTNPDNLAETAIEVVAKPKGKRPSSISQLSGGEKTLTATALLFSIYLIKPAPFCIFDEVDAPLDDTNVEKFTQLIRTFSDNSQFIIVTHNKQTMRAVDIIYGITMQEAGVSKIVPVDFRQLD